MKPQRPELLRKAVHALAREPLHILNNDHPVLLEGVLDGRQAVVQVGRGDRGAVRGGHHGAQLTGRRRHLASGSGWPAGGHVSSAAGAAADAADAATRPTQLQLQPAWRWLPLALLIAGSAT